jgi:drug/metabolite transporter (DMT)-like permease
MTTPRDTMRGIAAMTGSQVAFVSNDVLVKLAAEALPMGEILFLRGLFASLLIGAAILWLGLQREFYAAWNRIIIWRGLGELGATYFYLLALFQMPIANVIIIFQATPLAATAGAAIFLKERVSWRRWLAIAAGFAGVLLVVRPGLSGFDAYGLLVLVSVLFVTLRDITTRVMPVAIPTLLVTFVTAVLVTLMGAAMGVTERWLWPSGGQFLQLAGAAALLFAAYFTIIAALRLGDVSVTAAFRYVAVVFAIGFGYAIWGDVPDAMTLLGSAIIIGAGIYTVYRERQARRKPTAGSAAVRPSV